MIKDISEFGVTWFMFQNKASVRVFKGTDGAWYAYVFLTGMRNPSLGSALTREQCERQSLEMLALNHAEEPSLHDIMDIRTYLDEN